MLSKFFSLPEEKDEKCFSAKNKFPKTKVTLNFSSARLTYLFIYFFFCDNLKASRNVVSARMCYNEVMQFVAK